MNMDRIDCLRAFVRTVETGSFSATARELSIGQPAVSKRIAMLEDEFGSQLFLRTTRKLRPTAEALRIYDLARQILENFDTARASLTDASPQPTGTLKLSLPTSFGRHFMMPVIAEFVRLCPQVRVDIRFSERFTNLVEEGVELAVRIGNLEPSTLVARRIGTIRRHLVATPRYLRDRALPRTPADLSDHQCIIYSRHPQEWAFESEDGRHVVPVKGAVAVDDADAMEQAVRQHLGIAILPDWSAAARLRSGEFKRLLPDYAISSLPLQAVYPETQWLSPRARHFLDLLVKNAERFAPVPTTTRTSARKRITSAAR
jgi:DNA-binding transcriptional LysR family regulator